MPPKIRVRVECASFEARMIISTVAFNWMDDRSLCNVRAMKRTMCIIQASNACGLRLGKLVRSEHSVCDKTVASTAL